MEDEKFDDVTRLLGDGSSRRRVVGGLVGGVLGALGLGVVAREDADAARRTRKVTVCQNGVTKRVSAKAWRRMRLSGAASKGACDGTTAAPTTAKPTTAKPTTQRPKCGKAYDRCNKNDPPCCKHDYHTGKALACKQGKKAGYSTCVPVDDGDGGNGGGGGGTTPAPRACEGGNASSCLQRNGDDVNRAAVCCQRRDDTAGTSICITAEDVQVAVGTCEEGLGGQVIDAVIGDDDDAGENEACGLIVLDGGVDIFVECAGDLVCCGAIVDGELALAGVCVEEEDCAGDDEGIIVDDGLLG